MKTLLVALALLAAAPVGAQTPDVHWTPAEIAEAATMRVTVNGKPFTLLQVSPTALAGVGQVTPQPLAIHGHPEKAFYASPAEWPTDSSQCHWKRSNGDDSIFIPATADTIEVPHSLGHIHNDLTVPRDAEIAEPFRAKFTIKAFHTAGRVTGFYKDHVRDLVFDGLAPGEMPDMSGDPMWLKIWTGTLVVDLGMEQPPYAVVKHGWASADLVAVTDLQNNDHVEARIIEQFWSMLDPSVPVPAYNPHEYGSRCDVQGAQREINHFGSTSVLFFDNLPLAPLVAPWTGVVATSGYGAANDPTLPDVIVQQRVDLDLHNGIPGRVLFHKTGRQNQGGLLTLDPAMFTPGTKHKMAVLRDQVDDPNEVASLFVTDFEVAASVPPPPPPPIDVCTNIEGVQTVVPNGLVLIGNVCSIPTPPAPVVTIFNLTITCDLTGCKAVIK